jgi:hypothetical protein
LKSRCKIKEAYPEENCNYANVNAVALEPVIHYVFVEWVIIMLKNRKICGSW